MTREYRTVAAFKQAIEQRLRTTSTSFIAFARRRQLVVFDRSVARIRLELGDAVTLKVRLNPLASGMLGRLGAVLPLASLHAPGATRVLLR